MQRGVSGLKGGDLGLISQVGSLQADTLVGVGLLTLRPGKESASTPEVSDPQEACSHKTGQNPIQSGALLL